MLPSFRATPTEDFYTFHGLGVPHIKTINEERLRQILGSGTTPREVTEGLGLLSSLCTYGDAFDFGSDAWVACVTTPVGVRVAGRAILTLSGAGGCRYGQRLATSLRAKIHLAQEKGAPTLGLWRVWHEVIYHLSDEEGVRLCDGNRDFHARLIRRHAELPAFGF